MIVLALLEALVLSIFAECAVGFLLGYRDKTIFIVILLANVITNPALNLILLLSRYFLATDVPIFIIILLEVLVVIVEWRILKFIYPLKSKCMLLLSILMNLCSYLLGIVIFR